MSEEAYRTYSTMESCLLSGSVRRLDAHVGDLHQGLDDTLSLLICLRWDVDNYIHHNPCQVCISLLALREELERSNIGGPGDTSIPAPPYQPSFDGSVPGPVGEGVERGLSGTPSSLPSLIPNTSSSSSGSHVSNDEVSADSSSSYFIFSEMGRSWVQRSRDVSIGGSSNGDSSPLAVPYSTTTFRVSVPSTHPSISDPVPTIHSYEPQVSFSFIDSPTLFSSLESPLLMTPSPTSPLDLSLEDMSLPPLCSLSSNQVRRKSASKKKNMH